MGLVLWGVGYALFSPTQGRAHLATTTGPPPQRPYPRLFGCCAPYKLACLLACTVAPLYYPHRQSYFPVWHHKPFRCPLQWAPVNAYICIPYPRLILSLSSSSSFLTASLRFPFSLFALFFSVPSPGFASCSFVCLFTFVLLSREINVSSVCALLRACGRCSQFLVCSLFCLLCSPAESYMAHLLDLCREGKGPLFSTCPHFSPLHLPGLLMAFAFT
jgi:hypothetical protein